MSVLVAEIPEICLAIRHVTEGAKSDDAVEEESRRMLEWVETKGRLSQVSQEREGWLVVGFAIWRDRIPEGAQADAGQQDSRSGEIVVPGGGEGYATLIILTCETGPDLLGVGEGL